MLTRYDPFRDFDRLTDRVFGAGTGKSWMPMDAYRDGDRVVVQFDLPGVDADAVDLTVERNVLSVKAERALPEDAGREWLARERPTGTFSRQVLLGDALDGSGVEANYDRGVLTVSIPVAEQAKPKKVEIKAAPEAITVT
jgi:HSP20 family protein